MTANTTNFEEGPLTDRQVRLGLRLNIISGCLGMMWVAIALNMPYTMLLDALGANGVLQGLSSTAIQLTLAAQIPGAIFLERLRRRRGAWGAIAIVHRIIWFIPAYIAWIHPAPPIGAHIVVAIATCSMLFGNFATAAWHSWMADLVPEQTRGRFWSIRQTWTMLFFLVAMAAAGIGLDYLKPSDPNGPMRGFALIFAISAVLGILDIVNHLNVPEPLPKRALLNRSLADRLIAPLQHPNFRRLAIAMGIWMFACTLVGTFGQLYLRHVLGASYSELSALSIAGSLGTVIAGLGAGYLIDRIGARAFGAVMILVAPCFGAAWFLVTSTPLHIHVPFCGATINTSWGVATMVVTAVFSAGFYSSVGLSHMSLLASTAPERGRTLAMAVQWTIIGILGAGGPILGGYIMDLFPKDGLHFTLLRDTHFHFIHALIILHAVTAWFVVLPIFLRIRTTRDHLSVLEAFDRVVFVNPIRFASGIYHARVMASPVTRRRRARAVEAAGETGTEFVIADLAARLGDPSSDVREAAVQSLGRIGTSEAIDALIKALQDPDIGLTVHLFRALRQCADPRAVSMALAHLTDANIEIVRESIRILGVAGDKSAVTPLLDLLRTTQNMPIAMAAAEALGRLGELHAVYQIHPRMRTTASTVARRAFAASMGDLLGEPDEFYRILTAEEHSHGSAITPLIARIKGDFQKLRLASSPSWRAKAKDLIANLDLEYESRNIKGCAAAAFELMMLLAECRQGPRYDGNAYVFLTALDLTDPRFAAGVWYLAVLNGVFERATTSASLAAVRELDEIRLAIFILASWARDISRHPSPQASIIASTEGDPSSQPQKTDGI